MPEATVNGKLMDEAEAAKVKAEISEGVEEEFEDAVENEGGAGDFEVTAEEMSIIRAELACEFPEDYNYLSNSYVRSVASKPYSKDPSVRRPLEYTMEKLTHVMEWREESGAPDLMEFIHLANGSEYAPEAVEQPQRLSRAKAVATSLNNGSFYWHGLSKDGHPILWLRCDRKPWYPDVDADLKALMILADAGIASMPKRVTEFICISDSSSPPPPNPSFMIGLLKTLVRGYPDRLHMLCSAPVGSIIQFVFKLLKPIMPGRLASKIFLMNSDDITAKLEGILLNGKADIPTHFGGPANHDKYYPQESLCPNRGKGSLKFDYFGMVERLEQAKKDFEASK